MATDLNREPWNKGIIAGQKAPLKLKEVWAVRMCLQLNLEFLTAARQALRRRVDCH